MRIHLICISAAVTASAQSRCPVNTCFWGKKTLCVKHNWPQSFRTTQQAAWGGVPTVARAAVSGSGEICRPSARNLPFPTERPLAVTSLSLSLLSGPRVGGGKQWALKGGRKE